MDTDKRELTKGLSVMATTNWTAADLPDLRGRTAVVTGATSGIGLITARELARVGARVVLAVRDVAKGHKVAANIVGDTEVRALDLASLASIHGFADAWAGDLDILVNNAGVMGAPEGRTADGFEMHMGTNHLGTFALTNLLLAHVKGRVVTVASQLHRQARLDVNNLMRKGASYNGMQSYRDSKLANILFTLELQRRLTEAGSAARAIAAHPGVAPTDLTRHGRGIGGRILSLGSHAFNDAERGALPSLFAATMDIPGGSYVGPGGLGNLRGYPVVHAPSAAATDATAARRLWAASAQLTSTDSPHARTNPSGETS